MHIKKLSLKNQYFEPYDKKIQFFNINTMQKIHFYRVFAEKNMLNKLIFWENFNKKSLEVYFVHSIYIENLYFFVIWFKILAF